MIFSLFPPAACRVAVVLAGVALGAVAGASQAANASARFDAIVQPHIDAGRFTGAVLVTQRGTPLFERGYGLANREWDIPNTPNTHFRIGSITKQFAAVCILVLEERGRLKLADPVSVHVPDAPDAWRGITLHHLLTHTSGISNVTRDPEFVLWKFQPTTVRQMVARFRDRPLDFAPGERHAYSNSNYLVLGLLIELVSGQRFGDFLRENVLAPLGLNQTGVDSNLAILPRRAAGYWLRNGEILNAPYSDMTVPHAGGAMYSTTHDLARWAEAVFSGDKLLTPASRAKLLTPAQDNYALGLRVATFRGRKLIEHGGNISGFSSHLRHYPEDDLTIVVLSNLSTGTGIVEDIVRELATAALDDLGAKPVRTPIAVPAAVLGEYSGVYDVGGGKQVTFRLVDGAFTAQPTGQPPIPVFAETETRFYFEALPIEVEFERDENDRVTHMLMKRDGRTRRAPRIGE